MRRNKKLLRKILEHVEQKQTNGPIAVPDFDDYSPITTHYHVGLCVEAGYLIAPKPGLYDGHRVFDQIERLTWNGHEALEEFRQNGCNE